VWPAVKGSARMLRVLRRAIRLTPPDVPGELRIVYHGEVLRLDTAELERVRRTVHRRGGLPNRSGWTRPRRCWKRCGARRSRTWRTTSPPARHGTTAPGTTDLVTELGERIEFHRFLVDWWPVLTPAGVLGWLANRGRLAQAAGRVLDKTEVDLLSASWAATDPSVADVALLDELRGLIGEPRRRRSKPDDPERRSDHPRRPAHYDEYAHIVVDEAQDLSPMQWRMVGRRGRYASWTIVGDPLQSAWPDPEETMVARDNALRTVRTKRQFVLRTNYRNSAEIFALAARVLANQGVAGRPAGRGPSYRGGAVRPVGRPC